MTEADGIADQLWDRLSSFVGLSGSPARQADDAVNQPMIRHWCQAVGDANPAYLSDDWTDGGSRLGIVAPPTMLQVWTHHDRRVRPVEVSEDNAEERLARLLQAEGYPSVVATECQQEYVRYLRPGDILTYRSVIDGISQEKKTRLGNGFFITTLVTYTAAPEEVVGRMRFVTFRFRPAASDA